MSGTLILNHSRQNRQQQNQQDDANAGEIEIGAIGGQTGGTGLSVFGQIPIAQNARSQQNWDESYDF
jgi:hypothetical protein